MTDIANRYTYRVAWSLETNEHVATCLEFPSISWLAPLVGDALYGCIAIVADILDDMKIRGETPPVIGTVGAIPDRAATAVDPPRCGVEGCQLEPEHKGLHVFGRRKIFAGSSTDPDGRRKPRRP